MGRFIIIVLTGILAIIKFLVEEFFLIIFRSIECIFRDFFNGGRR